MSTRMRSVGALVVLAAVVLTTGCGGSSSETGKAGKAIGSTTWLDTRIVDVAGQPFTIRELAGSPVFVENFATWCSNCLRQLGDTQKAAAAAGDRAEFVALSVETDIDPLEVSEYAKQHHFDDIRFAVMTPRMLAAMKTAYGNSALNPPSTPKILVSASSAPGRLVTGFESPSEIAARLDATSDTTK